MTACLNPDPAQAKFLAKVSISAFSLPRSSSDSCLSLRMASSTSRDLADDVGAKLKAEVESFAKTFV